MRVMLFGATGMLGHEIAATAPPGVELVAPPSADLDIADAAALREALAQHAPQWVVNAAGYTHVDMAELEPDIAARVNTDAPRLLGEEAARQGFRVLHYSTDYVFSGTQARPYREDDEPAPVSTYGRTKLEGERALVATGARTLVVRTAWLYGMHGKSFPRTMWQRARAGEATRVVDDQHGRPTSAVDLARATWKLVEREAEGIVHASNTGPVASWYDVARRVFERAGVPQLLTACATADYATHARRPASSALDTTRLRELVGDLPPWTESLERFIAALESEPAQASPLA